MANKYILTLLLGAVSLTAGAQSNYDFSKMRRENLGRGVVAVRENPKEVAVSWRYLESDPEDQSFDVFRDGKKLNSRL